MTTYSMTPLKASTLVLLVTSLLFSCAKDKEDPAPQDGTPAAFECPIESPQDKADRKMGLDLLDITETGTFEQNMDIASDLGVDFIALHIPWTSLEPEPGVYTDPNNALSLLAQEAEGHDMTFSLTIRPIDLTGKTVPSDLEDLRFNDPLMTDRFQDLIDHVFTLIQPETFHNIQIGNEIDGYDTSSEHPEFWSDYGHFLFESSQYIHTIAPDLPVGYTGQFHGLTEHPEIFSALNNAVDIMGVTYYPLGGGGFSVDDPSLIIEDVNELVTTFPDIDIYIQEIGYQTSSTCASSESMQAEFFCNFFESWDQHADRIKSVELVRLNDMSLADAEGAAIPYGITDEAFIEYLRTLGLRTYEGTGEAKQAFHVIDENMAARGW